MSYKALAWDSKVEAEVAEWPGAVIVRREQGRKHQRLYLRFGEAERYVSYSTSPSDFRAGHKHIADVRRTLSEMGAARNERRKAAVRRTRNKPKRDALAHIQAARPKADPFEVLKTIRFADNEKDHATNHRPARWFLANIGSRVKKILAILRRL